VRNVQWSRIEFEEGCRRCIQWRERSEVKAKQTEAVKDLVIAAGSYSGNKAYITEEQGLQLAERTSKDDTTSKARADQPEARRFDKNAANSGVRRAGREPKSEKRTTKKAPTVGFRLVTLNC
jgi:hypothetical protein